MKCHQCGGELKTDVADLPFKVSDTATVVIKQLPIQRCTQCWEYYIEALAIKRVDAILAQADPKVEMQVVTFAA
jgi:YgiT-type zinc finger domain-containing protein